MKAALLVNPFSREELSDAIKRALDMPLQERLQRWEALMAVVKKTDVSLWRDAFVGALKLETRPAHRLTPDAPISVEMAPQSPDSPLS